MNIQSATALVSTTLSTGCQDPPLSGLWLCALNANSPAAAASVNISVHGM
jgi:hypothetical protein